ncbi:MAG: hypothetical protein N3H31_01715 [Candidatus Nezhaarchaeota archaeon]|nr:hypothetical protein [Candidatus Nezhaarchaeota archaeon]
MSVLLMVGVALALSGFVGLYLTSYLSSSSRVVSLVIVDAGVLKLGNSVYFHITLRNTGTIPVKIVDVGIHTPNKYYSTNRALSIAVASGGTVSLTEQDLRNYFTLSSSHFELGSSYLVRVFVEAGGSLSVYSTMVTCQG